VVLLAALALPGLAHAGTVFLLDGRGWGHGVGMSQWGAEGYARHGYGYRRILAHYYPHTHITATTPSDVRVLLQQGQPMLRVGSSAPFLVVDARGEKVHLSPRTVVVRRGFKQLVFPLRFEPGVQPLRLGGDGYRGAIVVKEKSGGLMAVNVLPLDRYLRGVVPWEVPVGWHTQTYEAQAVAARSYTLAMLKPGEDFDLYPDDRSQMYGGIKAERTETNLAIGATAGQVLEFGDAIIPAYYFSSSGGRTSSIHDAWPQMRQVPYLVSVADPYDYISPHHVWPTTVLTAQQISTALQLGDVRDLRVVRNSSGRAEAVRALTSSGWRQIPGQLVRARFKLGSMDFEIHALTLDDVPQHLVYGDRVVVRGWLRGLGKARLQELTGEGWQTVRHVRPAPTGQFAVSLSAVRSTELRLAYNGVAGDTVPLQVTPRVTLTASEGDLHARVSPSLTLQVQRLTRSQWRAVASSRGVFNGPLRPGSYRVAVQGGSSYASAVTPPVSLHAPQPGQ
jgi:stage II sporulation protein D